MQQTRRSFLKQASLIGAGTLGFPAIVRGKDLNSKLQCAFIATGGKAQTHIRAALNHGLQCVAFADVDKTYWRNIHKHEAWKNAVATTDWRELFQNHGKEIDLVFITTPDHTHFAPTMTAIQMGIHCYTEKPLSWSVKEAQLLTKAYKENPDVVTQMGNQGHAGQGWRLAAEYIQEGALGDITEFHTWTDRPIWPQGGKRPTGGDPIPENLNWDAWIGAAPMRPYKKKTYHRFFWRGFVDFGCGALGDMACHTTDGIYAIMNPGYAESCEPIYMSGPVEDQFPEGMTVKANYRATSDRPGFSTYWYEGKNSKGEQNMPETPEEMTVDNRKLPANGNLIIGTKGKMLVRGHYWESPLIIPNARRKEVARPKQTIERSPGHHEEFLMACRGEKPRDYAKSNFSYSGPMTANILLNNLAVRAGKKIEFDESGEITSDAALKELTWREPRDGWGPLKS